jgi:hypothetical protein
MIKRIMKRLIGICFLAVVGNAVSLGQQAGVPTKWVGTWVLSLPESKLDKIFGPGVPAGGLTVTGQTIRIEGSGSHMKVAGETVLAGIGPVREEFDLDLDHAETMGPGGTRISFKRTDDSTFDIILSVNNQQLGNNVGENHFVFSGDGETLTETKIHTEREVVPEGTDQTKGKVRRTSTTVLVFHK